MSKKKLEELRNDTHFGCLPDNVRVPALGKCQSEVVKPTELATLDDIAFAILGVEADVEALNSRAYALRRLHRLARANGALGEENAVDAVTGDKGGV